MKNHPFRFTLSTLAIAACFPALADSNTTSTTPAAAGKATNAGEIVVVATRQPSRVNALTADVTVLDRADIEQAGPESTLGDLLARTPGIEMARQGGRGAQESIFIRGANSGHTLVLLDGLRVSSATLGETAIESLPLAQVERIEILHGAASALYGSDAIGGVIRITTRPAADGPRLDLSAGGGSHGAEESAIAHSNRIGAFDYALRFTDSRSDGESMITNPSSPAYNPDKDGFRRRTSTLHANWHPGESTEIGAQWFESDEHNYFDASWPSAAYNWQTHHKLTSYAAHAQTALTDFWRSELRVGRSEDRSETEPSTNFGQASDLFKTRQDQISWQNDIRLPLGQLLAVVENLREHVDSTNVYTKDHRDTDSLVLGWNGDLGAHFWQIAARHDDNSQFGGKTTHTLGYGYRFSPLWRVSANTGTSFKAPTFNDLYFPNTPYVGAGNPALKPETGRTHEAALNYDDGNFQGGLTVFRNDIHNLIQWEESPPGSYFYTPRNIGRARIDGATLSASTLWQGWKIGGHLTLQNPKDRESGEYLVRRARKFGALTLDRDAGAWSWGGELQAAGAREDAPDFYTKKNTQTMGGYGVVNLHGEYRITPSWSLFGRVDNLFDKQYRLVASQSSDYASLGFTVFAGVRFALR